MKDLAIIGSEFILLILASLRKLRQSICNCICVVLAIVNLKMVLRELLGPTDLSKAQAFCIHEAMKVVVVCENEYFVLAAFQIVTPYFKGFDNS